MNFTKNEEQLVLDMVDEFKSEIDAFIDIADFKALCTQIFDLYGQDLLDKFSNALSVVVDTGNVEGIANTIEDYADRVGYRF